MKGHYNSLIHNKNNQLGMGTIIAQLGFKNTVYQHSKLSRNEFAMSSGEKSVPMW